MAKDRAHDPKRKFDGYTNTHGTASVSTAYVPTTSADNMYSSHKSVGLSGKGKAKDVVKALQSRREEGDADIVNPKEVIGYGRG